MRNLWLRGIVIVCLRMMWLRGIVIISDFLTGISSVRHMIISQRTVKFMLLDIYSQVKVGPVPKFNNLSRLQAVFASSSLPILPAILESCPNLKHLILVVGDTDADAEEMGILRFISVPRCFLSTLECVEIKGMFEWHEKEKKIASYFFQNSSVLKKLILSFTFHFYRQPVSDSDIYNEVFQLTNSTGCQIIIDYESSCSELMRALSYENCISIDFCSPS